MEHADRGDDMDAESAEASLNSLVVVGGDDGEGMEVEADDAILIPPEAVLAAYDMSKTMGVVPV